VVKPAPEKKKQAPEAVKAAPAVISPKVVVKDKASAPLKESKAAVTKSKPPSKRMHPEAIKRRDVRLKAKVVARIKPSPPSTNQIDIPTVAREIPLDTYTVVYAGSLLWLDSKKVRRKLQRGETIQLTQAGYEACSDVLRRTLVKGNLTMEEVHALLKQSRGQVPGAVSYGKAPLEAIDFASAMPVKDQDSQATSVGLSLPNFVPMATDDIKAWAGESRVRDWLGDLPEELTKKHEIVKAIKDRVAELEAAPNSKPGVPEVPAAPGGGFEDV